MTDTLEPVVWVGETRTKERTFYLYYLMDGES